MTTNLQRGKKLRVGDVVVVSNAMFGLSEYPVKRVEGNKAITDFRVFNTKIYPPNMVYEYGKRLRGDGSDNDYWVKTTPPTDTNLQREKNDIEVEELGAWGSYAEYYFWEVLSGEKSLETAREDLLSFRNSTYYTGTKPEYKEIKEDL